MQCVTEQQNTLWEEVNCRSSSSIYMNWQMTTAGWHDSKGDSYVLLTVWSWITVAYSGTYDYSMWWIQTWFSTQLPKKCSILISVILGWSLLLFSLHFSIACCKVFYTGIPLLIHDVLHCVCLLWYSHMVCLLWNATIH